MELNRIIEQLQKAVKVCDSVKYNDGKCEKTYAYAAGYSHSVMTDVIKQLQSLNN